MLIGDTHVHSSFSADSETPAEENIKKAIQLHLPYICLTDHLDLDYPDDEYVFDFDKNAYFEALNFLKEKYKKEIKVLIGIEMGMQPQLGEQYEALMKEYPFDFCIGSQHLVNGADPYYPETFQGVEAAEIYRQYFHETLEDIKLFHSFDSLGHLDYIVRYGNTENRSYRYEDYADVLDEILKTLIRYDRALEVNTAGIRKKLGNPNPSAAVLKRYKELGGELITMGSDSHQSFSIGFAFGKTAALLRKIGFSHVAYYEKREPKFVKI